MSIWKFQLLPHVPNVVCRGYRMDPIGQAIDQEVNDPLPYRFRFHKISKLVLILGPGTMQKTIYQESLGVAQKVIPSFDLLEYANASDAQKISTLHTVIISELRWFEQNFEDAGFIAKARAKLTWAG